MSSLDTLSPSNEGSSKIVPLITFAIEGYPSRPDNTGSVVTVRAGQTIYSEDMAPGDIPGMPSWTGDRFERTGQAEEVTLLPALLPLLVGGAAIDGYNRYVYGHSTIPNGSVISGTTLTWGGDSTGEFGYALETTPILMVEPAALQKGQVKGEVGMYDAYDIKLAADYLYGRSSTKDAEWGAYRLRCAHASLIAGAAVPLDEIKTKIAVDKEERERKYREHMFATMKSSGPFDY